MARVTVLGSGSWGTALAVHLSHANHGVRLWGRDAALIADMKIRRANAVYLPDVTLPAAVQPTGSLDEALDGAELVVAAIPSHGMRHVLRAAASHIAPASVVVSATKGLEEGTLHRMSQVIEEELPGRRLAVLSGPSFAAEVARQLPTVVAVAATRTEVAERVQHEFKAHYFRLYAATDVAGVEIGGALKNIVAIAAGVVDGLGLGHNALSALITRALAEITRVACAAGAQRETLAGLSGLGDLVLTCTGTLSRNRHVGIELARGRSLTEILASMKMVAEGVKTTGAALALGERYGVELPIATQVADVLEGRRSPREAVETLMLRRQRAEAESV
jgi:glycerol-3-phosphate dehydrogenase (NAD(P)+)